MEVKNGMVAQVLKDKLFNTPLAASLDQDTARLAAQGVL